MSDAPERIFIDFPGVPREWHEEFGDVEYIRADVARGLADQGEYRTAELEQRITELEQENGDLKAENRAFNSLLGRDPDMIWKREAQDER